MKNANQTKIAMLCVFLFSKTLFASDLRISPSTPIRTTPTSAPRITPDLTFGRGPRILGTFGTAEAELAKKNLTNAKASCIQDAASSGEQLPNLNDSSVWEFATLSSRSPIESYLSSRQSTLQNKFESSASRPAAFKKTCSSDVQATACASLLNKSMNEATQAYYQSALQNDRSVWDEVLDYLGLSIPGTKGDEHMDVVSALQRVEEERNPQATTGEFNSLKPIENQDPLLVATKLIIQRLDESLVRDDREGAEKAKYLLKKINPSAAYASNCVLGEAKNGGLNEDLDPAGHLRGSYFGPLSGVD